MSIKQEHIDKIKNADVVSFDLFDTLLARPFLFPRDLWIYAEKNHKHENFSSERVKSDVGRCVDIHQQYENMPEHLKNALDDECNAELDFAVPIDNNIEMFNLAKQLNKTCIIATDMYLPKSLIEKMLKKIGVIGYDKLYLSNDIKAIKSDGTMFDMILHDFPNKKILHIGDNQASDFEIPLRHKIDAIHTRKIHDSFLCEHPFVLKWLQKHNTYENRTIAAVLSIAYAKTKHEQKQTFSYWKKLSSVVGTMIVVSYVQFILNILKQKKLSCLLFIARDGYILKKIIDKQVKMKTIYAYAPRMVMLKNDKDEKEEYVKYVKSLGIENDEIGIVDTVTNKFTAQKLLSSALNKDIFLFAYVIFNKISNGQNFLHLHKDRITWCHLVEFMMSAPHFPVKSVKNNKPVYMSDIIDYEKFKIALYEDMSIAIESCSDMMLNCLQKMNITIDQNAILSFVDEFMHNLTTEDKQHLLNIKNGDFDHKSLYGLMFPEKYFKM